jgi:hypothetical protein
MADCFLCLGFLADASKWLVKQGLRRPDKLLIQTDETIDNYVAVCHKPGGVEQGHVCPMDAVALLKQAAWGARNMQRVDRGLDTLKISEQWCQGWAHQIDLEKNWDNNVSSGDYPKADLAKQPAKLFEALETLLGRMRGVTRIPLLRVVRKDIQGPDMLNGDSYSNIPCGESGSTYLTIDEEMIARAPILASDYDNDKEDTKLK